jgi:copper(I)-binding protein
MRMADRMMHMEKQDTVIIGPHASLTLKSGESHLMLMQPRRKLKHGDNVPITLHCGTEARTFNFPVQAPQLN